MHPNEETLNDYVDAALDPAAHAAVQQHIDGCTMCALLVAELQHLVREAASLPPIHPPSRVWDRLESQLGGASAAVSGQGAQRNGRNVWSWKPVWTLATAAAVIIMIAAGARYLRLNNAASEQAEATSALAFTVESELREAEGHYQKAIAGLEQIADAEKGTLDPATAATLQKNLAVIDVAIDESREALRANPVSVSAQESLLLGLKAKVVLLQDTVSLINELRPRTRG